MKCPRSVRDDLVGAAVERQPLLAHAPADDRHGAGGQVVIVKARVVVLHPADQPRRHMGIADQLLIPALARVVLHEVDPQLGAIGQLSDERLELRSRKVASPRPGNRVERAGPVRRGAGRCWRVRRSSRRPHAERGRALDARRPGRAPSRARRASRALAGPPRDGPSRRGSDPATTTAATAAIAPAP